MSTFLVAPTEPPALKALGVSSSEPEKRGVDVLSIIPNVGMVGIQRKEIKDLCASLRDGRLGKECSQMQSLARACLVIEGDPRWTSEGVSMLARGWTHKQQVGVEMSLMEQGIRVLHTDSLSETVRVIPWLVAWVAKQDHTLLRGRPKQVTDEFGWGEPGSRDWGAWLWMSFEGIGQDTAYNLYDAVGLPFKLTVTEKELRKVKGIGPMRVKRIVEMFA